MSERDAFKKLLEDFNKIEDSVGKNDIEVEVASPIKVRLLAELKARQLKDPKTEVMVVKNNKVIVIDKKDLPKYVDDGWALAEAHGGKHTTTGRSMTKGEEKEKERLVKGMKKNKSDFKKRYGKDADAVMYATATKKAMEDDAGLTDQQKQGLTLIAKKYMGRKGGNGDALPIGVLKYKDATGVQTDGYDVEEMEAYAKKIGKDWNEWEDETDEFYIQSKISRGLQDALEKVMGDEDFYNKPVGEKVYDFFSDYEENLTSKQMEGQVMSFEQMDKIYSGLKNAIDLYEKLVGDIEDPMADFTDDLGSDIVNYTKQGPLSSAPEIKNIENLSQSQMLTLASMARQAIDLAQSDVGANVTDIPAAEEFVKKLDVAIKGVKELDTKDLQRFPANVMKGKTKGKTDRDKAYFKMQQKRKAEKEKQQESELAVKRKDLAGMLIDRFNAFFREASPEEIKTMARLLDYKTRDEDKEFVKIEKEDIEETMFEEDDKSKLDMMAQNLYKSLTKMQSNDFKGLDDDEVESAEELIGHLGEFMARLQGDKGSFAENDKECPPGQYYCNDEQKCKPIPAGHEVEPDGNLKPIQKDAKQVLIDFQAKINEFAKNLGVTPKMLFAGLIEKNPELADNPIAKKIGEYSKALMQSK